MHCQKGTRLYVGDLLSENSSYSVMERAFTRSPQAVFYFSLPHLLSLFSPPLPDFEKISIPLWSSGGEVKLLSPVRLFATPWTIAYQPPWSMGFSRQEYWSGLPFPFPGDLPDSGNEHGSPALWADALPSELPGRPLWRRELG